METITATYILMGSVPVHVYQSHKDEINYKAYTMIVAIANYSNNELCRERCRWILENENDIELKQKITSTDGSFMTAVYLGDFSRAYRLADDSNRKALGIALYKGELEI